MPKSIILTTSIALMIFVGAALIFLLQPKTSTLNDDQPRQFVGTNTSGSSLPTLPPEDASTKEVSTFKQSVTQQATSEILIQIHNCESSPSVINVKPGEDIFFENNDDSTHVIHAGTKSDKENVATVPPGEIVPAVNLQPIFDQNPLGLYCEWSDDEVAHFKNIPFAYIMFTQ
jgi:plastocyanin